jgi:pyruvate/2-oxoglutarate dehydrogenase complex dihydrolipoamide dehydrogenase (E3) component
MSTPEHYDAIIIGSGQAGTPLASALANAGFKTALIEREHVAGTCINEGCTPTKTMIASGRVAYLARRGADYGVHTGEIRIDMARVRQRKRDIVDRFRNSSQARLEKTARLHLIFGEARFTGPKTIQCLRKDGGTFEITAEWIFINAGCRPSVPPLEGLDTTPFLNSTSIMELDSVPDHLLVLGGGYIGLEFGQLFRRLGSRVTIIQGGPQLLGREDPDVAAELLAILQQDGVTVLLNAKAQSAAKAGTGVQLSYNSGNALRLIDGSHVLVATGRAPNSGSLELAAAGIATDPRGFIKVDARLETNVEGVYALGDINGGPAFTHISYDDFRIIRTNLIEKGAASTAGRLVPFTLFTDPQLGRIGLSETEARAQKKNIRVAKMPMTRVARALEVEESRGFIKAIVDADTKQILGAAVLGLEGGEVMAQLQIAMMGKLPYTVLRDAVLSHPTLAEALNNLFTLIDA